MEFQVNVYTLLIQVINFIILFYALKSVLYEPMLKAIGERQGRIKVELDEAESVNREAVALKQQYDTKLKSVQQEGAEIIASANKEGERRKAELLEEARKEAQFLVEKGRTELTREQQQALSDLRGRVVDLSVEMASRLFRDTLTPDHHRALVEQFVKKAGQLNVG